MSLYASSGDLPKHLYCYVDSSFIRKGGSGFEPCIWFGLRSQPGQAWGLHIVLECGAIYRNVPPHAISFDIECEKDWKLENSQHWDCYGLLFSTIEYSYLSGLRCETLKGLFGRYLFTAVPVDDAFTANPEQSKEFSFIELDNGRLTVLPTNMFRIHDKSFTEGAWPKDLKVSNKIWRVE